MDPKGAKFNGFVFCTGADMEYNAISGAHEVPVRYRFEGPNVELFFSGMIGEFAVGEYYEIDLAVGESLTEGCCGDDCNCRGAEGTD